jgi:hypothetical protein
MEVVIIRAQLIVVLATIFVFKDDPPVIMYRLVTDSKIGMCFLMK